MTPPPPLLVPKLPLLTVRLEPGVVIPITPDDLVLAQVSWRERMERTPYRDLLDAPPMPADDADARP